jgi:hypothetical protein
VPFLAGEGVDEFDPVCVVLAYVVVIDCLLEQPPGVDEVVDGFRCSISHLEEWIAVDLADASRIDLHGRVRPDHLQVEHQPAGLDRFDHVAQDVHDVLGIDASE